MSWKDPEPIDAFWFAVAPLTSGPVLLYSAAGWTSGEYPFGVPDWKTSARNSLGWFGVAGAVYAWNLLASPHNAVFTTGTQSFRAGGHMLATSAALIPVAAVVVAVAAAVGYVSTSDVHLGATGMLVGDMNMGVPVSEEVAKDPFWPWNR